MTNIFKRPGQFDSQRRILRPSEVAHRVLRCDVCSRECAIATVMDPCGHSVHKIIGRCPVHGTRRRARWEGST